MWSRAFPGLVLLAAAGVVVGGYADSGPAEHRLIAAGVAVVFLVAAAAAMRVPRDTDPPVIVPAPPILPRAPSAPNITPIPLVHRAQTRPPLRPPSRGSNYEIVSSLASGGMGAVFLAWQRGPGEFRRLVVLKRLHTRLTGDARAVEMFLHEAQVAAGFSHPNIVPIHELYQDDDGSYVMVMEYVYGPTLLAVLRQHNRRGVSLPYGAIVRIASAICDALHYAYGSPGPDGVAHHIIHRDISPSNVMIRYDGEVKLLDFGLATVGGQHLGEDAAITGKLGYMSPEQLCGEVLDHQTDVFSLGIVMWEMATGRRLFRRDSDVEMVHAILRAPIPSPRSILPWIDAGLDDIIVRSLSRDRRIRYPDAAAIARDLRQLADDRGWSRKRADLITLIEGVDAAGGRVATATVPYDGGDIPIVIPAEASVATDVVDGAIDFGSEPDPLTVEHTALLAQRVQRAQRLQTPV